MSEYYVGQINLFAFDRIPRGWVPCDGRSLSIRENTALFAMLSTTFGGDGHTNFNVPDLRSRVAVGRGARAGVAYEVGQYGGVEGVTLTQAQLPPHSHTVIADETQSVSPAPSRNYFAIVVTSTTDTTAQNLYASAGAVTTALNPAAVSVVGGGAAHDNIQPYLALSFCIAVSGIYPPRP